MTTVAATTGVVQWFANQRMDLLRDQHSSEVQALNSRLASIRIAAGNENHLLNIKDLQISQSRVRSLSAEYEYFPYHGASGGFYVSLPTTGVWDSRRVTSLDLAQKLYASEQVLPPRLARLLERDKWVLWESENQFEVLLADSKMRMTFVPFVGVSKSTRADIEGAIGDVLGGGGTLPELEQQISAITEILEGESDSVRLETVPTDEERDALGVDREIDLLAELYTSDLGAVLLRNMLSAGFSLATEVGGTFRLEAVERKGNVLYMRSITEIPTVEENGEPDALTFDQELIWIVTGDDVIVVRSNVPSKALRSDAYAWSRAWLAGLRLPIDVDGALRSLSRR